MRHFSLFCVSLLAFVLLIDAKTTSAPSTANDSDDQTNDADSQTIDVDSQAANSPRKSGISKGVNQIVQGSLTGTKDITQGGLFSGIGKIIRGALTGAGNIAGGALGV